GIAFIVIPCLLFRNTLIFLLQDAIDSLEFARGSKESTWGSVRAAMGHPEPFPLKYVALGNEDCEIFKPTYQGICKRVCC
ncbi:Os11g0132000, partial [Oryza sativa Japonica Group]